MAITTLLAFWIDQKTRADAAVTTARNALSAAQTTLAARRADLAAANENLAGFAKETARIRAALAEAATPADVEALTPELAKAIRDTRAGQAAIIAAESAIDAAQTSVELATADAAVAAARAARAAAALDAADQPDKDLTPVRTGQAVRASNSVSISNLTDHPFLAADVITVTGMADASFDGTFTISTVTGTSITYPQTAADATSGGGVVFGRRALRLRHSLAKPPLSSLVSDATTTLGAKPWTDAKARMASDFPAKLRDCADERAKVETAVVDNDKKEAAETRTVRAAALASTESLRDVFEAADATFREYVVNALNRFAKALAVSARIADPKQNPLTAAEKASIESKKPDGTTDTALETRRNTAADARKAVATAQIDVDARQTDLDIARMKVRAADIDIANPDADPAVAADKAALQSATTALATAQTGFTAAMHDDLVDWESAVPDTAWRNLADFEDAKRLLVALQTDPAPLVTAMDNAEAALVTALIAADKAERALAFLDGETVRTAAQTRFDAGSLPRRELSALRGDS